MNEQTPSEKFNYLLWCNHHGRFPTAREFHLATLSIQAIPPGVTASDELLQLIRDVNKVCMHGLTPPATLATIPPDPLVVGLP